MVRLALYMQDKHPIKDEIEYSKYAEQNGFEAVWFAESRLARDAIVPMAAVASNTSKITVASGVVNNWTRNVGLMAATFGTLYELAPDRVILGVGAWWEPLASKVGVKREKPLLAMKEYVTVLKRLFNLESVTFHGKFVNVTDIQIDVVYGEKKPRKVPVYIGATGFEMLELAGEIADGVVLNYLVSPEYNKKALEMIKKGAAKTNRRLEEIDRPQLVVVSMDYDEDKAIDRAKTLVSMYLGQQPHIMKASGVSESLISEVNEALGGWPAKPGGLERAKKLVPDEVVKMLTVTGTPDQCRKKVKEYIDSGATSPIMYPLGDDVKMMIREMAKGY
ncbi:MAG: LLM class flavin-dependent oxidoreductase [Nitrososphaerota archaeon]|nr:LLM class flavin-dependent oxidoreductase [Nitrososphaerota archaeon]MDG6927261.1 LLM class flavin-dependent oxidoreductase [Nitrososphaerota archaeon]MDG6930381.1 LLM class flavin-dependent oxidoreductase [Nitrososphaerota archaeon]MDG6932588.1 LLM class flavin-dependent oxidoreductase [Nitrososphaerota archaeon]MDG6935674.1 LLM class flavin-dependent oxidoreductase [Nitrososphaerota archaeon]